MENWSWYDITCILRTLTYSYFHSLTLSSIILSIWIFYINFVNLSLYLAVDFLYLSLFVLPQSDNKKETQRELGFLVQLHTFFIASHEFNLWRQPYFINETFKDKMLAFDYNILVGWNSDRVRWRVYQKNHYILSLFGVLLL